MRGFIVTDDPYDPETRGPWTTGIIAENPHLDPPGRRNRHLPESLDTLARSELLLCDLRQHHVYDEPRASYHLDALEWAWTSDTVVCRPLADWPYPDGSEDHGERSVQTT